MPRFLILGAEGAYGRGSRGANLHRFLRIFHGADAVDLVSVSALETGPLRHADVLFIGVPSSLAPRHLERLRFRRAVAFDYGDKAGPDWEQSDEALLRSLTDLYLKASVEPGWDFGLRWGTLPIRRYPGLTWMVGLLTRLFPRRYPDLLRRDHDVSFLGNTTSYFGTSGNDRYAQRVEWLSELAGAQDRISFWGGLQAAPHARAALENRLGPVEHLFYERGRVPFPIFFQHLLRSRLVLTPTGNARWSYRQYEAIYAGAVLVSTDFQLIRTLIPLPLDGMIHVPDHEPVLPAIDRGLELRRAQPELPRRNIEFLEQFLDRGDYSATKPALRDAFLSQLG